ncbi:hypothetical protein OsJ_34024 [Oryza sativa Japonica Group]|uniref:Uncharacterized protein n=1 Tax=Oryza sativa subsp. japonica TaxID=39947 RepID=B9GAW3_ORYSJ|nr:hypothetical protein OsJ_34024 [Oryza sativa Japonica Group]
MPLPRHFDDGIFASSAAPPASRALDLALHRPRRTGRLGLLDGRFFAARLPAAAAVVVVQGDFSAVRSRLRAPGLPLKAPPAPAPAPCLPQSSPRPC